MLWQRVRKHFRFSKKELTHFGITIFITAIIFSFRMWGNNGFDAATGLANLGKALLFSGIALFLHIGGQKFYAVRKGMRATYSWDAQNILVEKESRKAHQILEKTYASLPYGLILGFFLAILTNGWLYILAPGWVHFDTIKKERTGKWRLRPYWKEYGFAVQWGIMANLLAAGIVHWLGWSPFFVKINLLIALFSLLPFPTYSGFHVFFVAGVGSTFWQYSWIVSFTIAYAALLWFVGFWIALIVAIIAGGLGFLFMFSKFKDVN